jgi:hypothetical protein
MSTEHLDKMGGCLGLVMLFLWKGDRGYLIILVSELV